MSVAVIDEDDDDDNVLKQLDAPASAIQEIEVAKSRIIALLEDQQRQTDYQNRLERKLLTLDTALAQQRNEVESLQRTLELEQKKDAADASSRQIEREQKTQKQEERIRNVLSDVLHRKAPPRPGKKNQVFEIDTVLISFIRPNDNVRYNLPFRVDNATTLKDLRDDACKYWGVSTEDFILKTMGNSKCQNEIMVQDCFKQGEIAQLRLESKNKEQTTVTEAEYKAIAPRNKKSRGRSNKDKADMGADSVLKFNDRFSSTLKKMGGIYFLLKLRDLKPSEHCSKIKPRDIFMYSFLAVLTFILYISQRRAGDTFWMISGITNALHVSVPRTSFDPDLVTEVNVPPFTELAHYEDVWDWLQISLPYILWRNSSQSIGSYNIMPGYVSIRQKRLKDPSPASLHCPRFQSDVGELTGALCPPARIDPAVELKDANATFYWPLKQHFDLHAVQDADTDFIRGPAQPWMFVNADDNWKKHQIGRVHGKFQTYDAGGYSIEYRATLPKKAPAQNLQFYINDMAKLRQANWLNNVTTRAIFIAFSCYNQHYDQWVAVQLTIELPPSGIIVTESQISPFIPNLFETSNEYLMAYGLVLRLIIGGYIAFVVAPSEMKHKTRNQKAGYKYFTSLNGVCDVCIVVSILCSIIFRLAYFSSSKTQDLMAKLEDASKIQGLVAYSDLAYYYESLFLIEGITFLFTMFRMVTLFRLNRMGYLLWHAVGRMAKEAGYLCCIFVPTFFFFSISAHRILGSNHAHFETLQESFLSVFHMTKGSIDISTLMKATMVDTFLAAIHYWMLYVFVTFLLITGFAAVFIESYYTVQLTAPSTGEPWGYDKWKNWLIHPMFLSCFHYASSGSAAPSDE